MKKLVLVMVVIGVVFFSTSCMSMAERKIYKKVDSVNQKLDEMQEAGKEPRVVDGSLVVLPSGDIVPDFVLTPPTSSEAYFGVGYAHQAALNLSIRLAETRARADIANQVKTSIQEIVQYYARDTGVNNPEALIEYTEIMTREVTGTTLVGLVITNRIPMKDGSVWIMARLDLDKVKESLELSMKSIEGTDIVNKTAELAEWKAQQAFKYLDDVMTSGTIGSVPVVE